MTALINKVLIVEDESDIREELVECLTDEGFDCVEASDGEEGLNLLCQDLDITIVLSDIIMPRKSGLEMIKDAQSVVDKNRDLEFIILTGHGGLKEAVEALRLGALDFLEKPIDLEHLVHVVHRAEELVGLKRTRRQYEASLEQRIAELAIANEEELIIMEGFKKMGLLVQTTTSSALITNRIGQIMWVSPVFLSTCGYTEDFVLGKTAGSFLQGAGTSQNTVKVIRDAMKDHKDINVEILNYKKSGETFWSHVIAAPIDYEGDFIGYVSIQEDITQKIIVDKMKAEFVATAAHELRTPMTIIFGYVELMKNGSIAIDNTPQIIDLIYEQSQAMIHLLDDILDIAKMEASAIGSHNNQWQAIDSLFKRLTDKFISSTNYKKIILNISPNLPDVNIDKSKIEQMINNLLSNADKYSPDNDTINIQVSQVMSEGIDKLLITIEDNGIGMTPEELNRIYEKFYRVDKTGKIPGTGLGMSIVKDIMNQHNGTIEIESQPSVGTKVMLYLPTASSR